MVPLPIVLASNASIPKELPPGLVAVFAGGTGGRGEETLKKLASLTIKPRIYIIGRSASAAEKIIAECRVLNPQGEYIFLQRELDMMRGVRDVCEEIKTREEFINLLALSAGGPDLSRTEEHARLLGFYTWLGSPVLGSFVCDTRVGYQDGENLCHQKQS
ncbi:hypothetical protein FKW77_003320 [Venturia effusa]|uniref:Ketoreductase (KR) domain-containing protein n=1 Tax=Venturia effusa TaxID=50376 RepID=A0A517LAP2_9PEZI|nr:hypothetical protein FKW77_003320 [Venturia effusa]